MVPREAGRGSSFKGAGLYYLHDKGASTTERVVFTHTENLPTSDPQKALGWMAWTAMIAPDLKRAAGVAATGRQGTRKPVYTVSLAWHPEQRPSRQQMIAEARTWLAWQGLKDHQVLMVAHSDREHPHIHLIINLVNPTDGRVHSLPYSKLKSSRYAQTFEQAAGKVYCPERVENNRRRDRGKTEPVKAKEELKATVAGLYVRSDSGRAFEAALRVVGLSLAKGKKLVVIDAEGDVHSLARLIDGATEKALAARLSGLSLPSVQSVQEKRKDTPLAQPIQVFDRDRDDRDWQEAVIDAGIAHAAKKTASQPTPTKDWQTVWQPPSQEERNTLKTRHLEERAALREKTVRDKDALSASLVQAYGVHERELRRDIASLTRRVGRVPKLWAVMTGKVKDNAERLAEKRLGLENVVRRKAEAYETLALGATKAESDQSVRQQSESLKLERAGGGDIAKERELAERMAKARAEEAARAEEPTAPSPPLLT